MDSQWFINNIHQATTRMNNYDHNNAGNQVDLTLKLGLPNSDNNKQSHLGHVSMTSHHANPNIDGSSVQGLNQYEMVNEGVNANPGQSSFNASQIAWPPKLGSHSHAQHMQASGHGFGSFQASYSMGSPFPMFSNPYNSFTMNPNPNYLLAPPPPTPTMNDYTLIDVPTRRVDRELGSSSSSLGNSLNKGTRKQRGGSSADPYRRCTNYNCNTNDTPMWRKGPLGPKTLCNACGIKYRKEEEKRRAKEAADKSTESHRELG